jgi:hypothetical protein
MGLFQLDADMASSYVAPYECIKRARLSKQSKPVIIDSKIMGP